MFDPSRLPDGAETVEARKAGRSEAKKPLKLEPIPDFYLMHHPRSWELVKTKEDGWELLPVLKRLPLVPGSNVVRLTRSGPDSALARTKRGDKGWVVLEEQDQYRGVIDVAGDEVAYLEHWDVVVRYPDGDYDRFFDLEAYYDFRRSLMKDGEVKPPRPGVLARMRRQLERTIGRYAKNQHDPVQKAAYEEAKAKLAGLEAAMKGQVKAASRGRSSRSRAAREKEGGADE